MKVEDEDPEQIVLDPVGRVWAILRSALHVEERTLSIEAAVTQLVCILFFSLSSPFLAA